MKVIGLPLTVSSVSPEFMRSIMESKRRILVNAAFVDPQAPEKSNDFMCAAVGYRLLAQAGYAFVHIDEVTQHGRALPDRCVVMMNAWRNEDGSRRRPSEAHAVVLQVMATLKRLTDAEIDFISQGSPKLYDSIAPAFIAEGAQVVDTASSADLAFEAVANECRMSKHVVRKILTENLRPGYANVVGCVGSTYGYSTPFQREIGQALRVWTIHVGDVTQIERLTGKELIERLKAKDETLSYKTVVAEIPGDVV